MQGWAGVVPPQFDRASVDETWAIEDGEAIEMTARLAQDEGIFAGASPAVPTWSAHAAWHSSWDATRSSSRWRWIPGSST